MITATRMRRILSFIPVISLVLACTGPGHNTEESLKDKPSDMKQTTISAVASRDEFKLIGQDWMLITAGTKDSFNMMTASWGGFGILWNKKVATIYVRPSRYTHDFIENNERLTLSFFPEECRAALQLCGTRSGRDTDKLALSGLTALELESGAMTFTQASLVLECRKLFKTEMEAGNFCDPEIFKEWYGTEDDAPHTIYILEIEKVYE